jgi:hypothetical protein
MRIRLTRKLCDRIDGIDLSRYRVGDVLDLSMYEAALLIAEGWAEKVDSSSDAGSRACAVGAMTHVA